MAEMGTEMWMEQARMEAGQCWCDEETQGIEMDVRLSEAFAKRIAQWMDTAAMFSRNEEFYRILLHRCAYNLGPLRHEAFVQDDGGVVDTPLALKIPYLVDKLSSMARGSDLG